MPREEVIVDLADKCCPCCNRLRVKLGEDVSERLDMIPARFKVIVTRRPKYACRDCDGEVAQAPAPEHLIEGGIPTEALIAAVVIAKYADHLPLYRQAQIYGRQGVELDRSTLADWSGRAAFALRPVYERLFDVLKGSDKLFADETRAPVLDPGRRRTKTGQLWAYARDDRPWGGPSRRASPMSTSPTASTSVPPRIWPASLDASRSMATAPTKRWPRATRLRWLSAGRTRGETSSTSRPRTRPRSPSRRWRGSAASTPSNAISGARSFGAAGRPPSRARPILEAMKPWLEAKLAAVSGKSKLAEAIRYALSRWAGLARYLDDGRIEIDNNVVERAMRPIALRRKNHLFAGSDEGGRYWAIHASLIETCKMNDVDPQAWLTDVLDKIPTAIP